MNTLTSTFFIIVIDAVVSAIMTFVFGGDDEDFKICFIGILLSSILFEVMK